MKRYDIKKLVYQNIYLLIPLIIYAIYKNGYLIYEKGLISFLNMFKPIYLVIISIIIKLLIDLIKTKKININYELVIVILIAMIMPYNINYLTYIISFTLLYILSLFLDKYIKYNKVCFIYLIIILINYLTNNFTFLNPLEENFSYSFTFLDLLTGRGIGGMCTTSILLSIIAYMILLNNYYYKKDIPLFMNITYIILTFIFYIITNNNELLLNNDLVFASIFICTLPMYSPYKRITQIILSIITAIIIFILAIYINKILAVYIGIFIISCIPNLKWFKFR